MVARSLEAELRYDFDEPDEEKSKMLEDIFRAKCREIFSSALLLMDRRKPEMVIKGGNLFEAVTELPLEGDANEA